MNEFKGTKGPWEHQYGNAWDGEGFYGFYGIYHNGCEVGRADNEYDARLISAAPELLEALQKAVDVLDGISWSPDVSIMQAAIDKALGESK